MEIDVDYGLTDIVTDRYDAGVRFGDQVAKDMVAVRIGPDLVGVTARTVRYYTAQTLLPSPQFRGPATRYVHEHLVHLAAIRALQRERRYSLAAIRRHLEPLPATELERLAALVLPELAPALAPAAAPVAAPAPTPSLTDAWHRLTLVPELGIHVQAAATADVQALARRIVAQVRGE